MHVNIQHRFCAALGEEALYYRLKESYRDVRGHVHSVIVLNIGFEPELEARQMHRIAYSLTKRFANRRQTNLFCDLEGLDDKEKRFAEKYWRQMITDDSIDRFNTLENEANREKEHYINANTMEHDEVREIGAEWLCKQAIEQLGIDTFLASQGWSKTQIDTALAHLIMRTVYAPSEWTTHRRMRENSAVCMLFDDKNEWQPGVNSLYSVPDRLLALKDDLEKHLCNRTDHLFNLQNRIVLFDLTNFYFEGSKRASQKAKFGRSKEKRSDCKLLVLALCINTEGFIRYSSILEGNTADPKSLPDMVEKLSLKTPIDNGKTLVVIDAGIATEENLKLIKEKGYNYLCVSRSKPKDYTLSPDHKCVTVYDSRKQEIQLKEVQTEENGDYLLEITSPSKKLTEASMNRQWKERFEAEIESVNVGILKKGGTKRFEKVVERVGRAIERYPSIAKYYNITYVKNEKNPDFMQRVELSIKDLDNFGTNHGVYFLRTNVRTFDEKTTWDYYNLIREIECTNRQLKTDLNLRPIYHQKDERCDAHLFFGLLSYWVVNTIRLQLKRQGETAFWSEIVRRMSTQKVVFMKAVNALDMPVEICQCSVPSKEAKEIYRKLGYKLEPFKRMKICRTQAPPN